MLLCSTIIIIVFVRNMEKVLYALLVYLKRLKEDSVSFDTVYL